ncbi:arachidonate 5-lipoxygenase-like [Paramuricea clavata]|uniref:Arachidonate 5-lipoxygenase-like n=1 Tax=Paramuricea clavata TaxID=317549 RepID=A0A6S7HH02_PARCT|nr:arachidonate 5-lipoxygenase-like [Paramuricea clavata]
MMRIVRVSASHSFNVDIALYSLKYQLSLAMTLGSLRYDKLFDYSVNLVDEKAKVLVKKYYDELHGEVNKRIIKRNRKRQLEGKFIYPYFMPQWLTNSIQT